ETVEAFQDHGEVRGDTVLEGVREAERLLVQLREAGIDYDDVVEVLEAEGVQKFADSFDELLAGIRAKRGELAAAGARDHPERMTTDRRELVERIWSRGPTVWTGKDEARWLGWLDEPARMREEADSILRIATLVAGGVDHV